MLLPMMAIMIAVRCAFGALNSNANPTNDVWPRRLTQITVSWLGHGLVAVAVIWLCFGFRYSMMAPDVPVGTMPLAWEYVLSAHPGWEPLIFGLRDFHILPEAFLYGFSYVLAFSLARGAFLDGQLSTEGWVEFFPKTFLYKTPTFELISIVLAIGVFIWWLRKRPFTVFPQLYRWVPGITLFVVYWTFSLTSNLNIGHRHILPTYPLLFIACGAVIWWVQKVLEKLPSRKGVTLLLGGGLLFGQLLSTASIYPHHLAYFNFLSGGPTQGYRHLADSSLDWGQDLPGLACWIEEEADSAKPVYLAYFGTGEPDHYGIEAQVISRLPKFGSDGEWYPLKPGTYAISATMLQHVYRQEHQPWSAQSETTFQNLRNLEPSFWAIAGRPEDHPELLDGASPEEWLHAWNLYWELRFTRLCEYLKVRPPEAMIGYSILVFELDQSELDRALNSDLTALIQAMEAAAKRPFNPAVY